MFYCCVTLACVAWLPVWEIVKHPVCAVVLLFVASQANLFGAGVGAGCLTLSGAKQVTVAFTDGNVDAFAEVMCIACACPWMVAVVLIWYVLVHSRFFALPFRSACATTPLPRQRKHVPPQSPPLFPPSAPHSDPALEFLLIESCPLVSSFVCACACACVCMGDCFNTMSTECWYNSF